MRIPVISMALILGCFAMPTDNKGSPRESLDRLCDHKCTCTIERHKTVSRCEVMPVIVPDKTTHLQVISPEELRNNSFDHLNMPKLTHLDLSYIKLKTVTGNPLRNMVLLKQLDIRNTGLDLDSFRNLVGGFKQEKVMVYVNHGVLRIWGTDEKEFPWIRFKFDTSRGIATNVVTNPGTTIRKEDSLPANVTEPRDKATDGYENNSTNSTGVSGNDIAPENNMSKVVISVIIMSSIFAFGFVPLIFYFIYRRRFNRERENRYKKYLKSWSVRTV